MSKFFSRGQSVAEYALAAALVAIVSIGALMMFSNDLAASLPGILDNIFGGGGTAGSANGGGGANGPGQGPLGNNGNNGGNGAGSGGQSANPQNPNNGSTSSSGWANTETMCIGTVCIELPVVTQDDVETAGGNGNLTKTYADVLDQIVEELKKQQPPPDPNLLGMIEDLANFGHEIGDEQNVFAGAVNVNCMGISPCDMGQSSGTGMEAGNLGGDLSGLLPQRDENGDGEPDAVMDFQDLLAILKSDPNVGSLPPGIIEIIEFESNQIISLAYGTSWLDADSAQAIARDPNISAADLTNLTLEDTNNATITHQDANVVCGTAGGSANCTVKTTGGSSSGSG